MDKFLVLALLLGPSAFGAGVLAGAKADMRLSGCIGSGFLALGLSMGALWYAYPFYVPT